MSEKQASPAVAFRLKTTLVELPDPGPDGAMTVEIATRNAGELIAKLGALPEFERRPKRKKDAAETLRFVAQSRVPMRIVGEAVIVAPPFSFDAREDGKAFWGDLSYPNQMAIFEAGLDACGLKAQVRDGGGAERAARFPARRERKSVRRASRRGREAAV